MPQLASRFPLFSAFCVCVSLSFASTIQAAHAEPSHAHTHTHSLSLSLSVCVSLSLSLSPAGGQAVNTRHSTSAFRSIGRSWIRAHFGSTAFNRLPYSNLRADIPSVIKCPLFSPFPPVSRRSLHWYIALRPPSTSDSTSCL